MNGVERQLPPQTPAYASRSAASALPAADLGGPPLIARGRRHRVARSLELPAARRFSRRHEL